MLILNYASIFPLCFLVRPVSHHYVYRGFLFSVVHIAGGRYLHFSRGCVLTGYFLQPGALWFVSSQPLPGAF